MTDETDVTDVLKPQLDTDPVETREEANARAAKCWQEIQTILAENHCRLQSFADIEYVGQTRDKFLTSTGNAVIPEPLE